MAAFGNYEPLIKSLVRSDDRDARDLGFQLQRCINMVRVAESALQKSGLNVTALSRDRQGELSNLLERAATRSGEALPPALSQDAFDIRRSVCKEVLEKVPHLVKAKEQTVPDRSSGPVVFIKYMEDSGDLNLRDFAEECEFAMHAMELAEQARFRFEGETDSVGSFSKVASDKAFHALFEGVRGRVLDGERTPASDKDVTDMHVLQRKLWRVLLEETTRKRFEHEAP